MVTAEPALPGERLPLSRERVLRTAVAIADEHGIDAVTMRRVGDDLAAEAMSLYHHVANKNDLLDGVVDLVAEEINDIVDMSGHGRPWQPVVRARILAARQVLLRHRWAPGLLATRSALESARRALPRPARRAPARRRLHLRPRAPRAARPRQRALGFSQALFDPGAGASAGPSARRRWRPRCRRSSRC